MRRAPSVEGNMAGNGDGGRNGGDSDKDKDEDDKTSGGDVSQSSTAASC